MAPVNAPGQRVPKIVLYEPVGAVHGGFVELQMVHGNSLHYLKDRLPFGLDNSRSIRRTAVGLPR